jgi:hypothetical protein
MHKTIQPKVFPMSMRLKHNLYPTKRRENAKISNIILFITLKKNFGT